MKGSFVTIAVIFVLSLAIWSVFYAMSGEPKGADETAVIVGICAGIVLIVKWVWSRVHKKEVKNGQKT